MPLFPELMARLDEIKRDRIGGLMLVRDWKDDKQGRPLPWPTGKKRDLAYMRHEVKRIIGTAGLPENLSFTSFRHGGLTETGEANASGSSNPGLLLAKLANSIQTSNALHKTYASVDVDAVLAFDKARLAGRQKRRGQNEN